jgi:hypothetical protein
VANTCHPSGKKLKIGGLLWFRPAWAKRKTLFPTLPPQKIIVIKIRAESGGEVAQAVQCLKHFVQTPVHQKNLGPRSAILEGALFSCSLPC